MIRVVIADDEHLERQVYRKIIESYCEGVEIVAEAETGRQAIEYCENYKPDLVLMDIKMPGINGIEAIVEVRKQNSRMKFILISAYNFFDYAKEAIQCGVESYILKPVAKDELIKTIEKTREKIEKERSSHFKGIEMKEQLKQIKPLLVNELMIALLMKNEKKVKKYVDFFELEKGLGCIAIGKIEDEKLTISINREITLRKIYEYLHHTLQQIEPHALCDFVSDQVVVIFQFGKEQESYIQKEVYLKLNHLQKSIGEIFDNVICFGIGRIYSESREMSVSYHQALTALKHIQAFSTKIIYYADMKLTPVKYFQYPYEIEKSLIENIRLGKGAEAIKLFNKLIDYIQEQVDGEEKRIKFEMMQLYFSLIRVTEELQEQDYKGHHTVNFQNIYERTGTLQQVYQVLAKEIEELSQIFQKYREVNIDYMMQSAISYLKKHYMEDVTLEDAANEVGFSPNYFSKLFKMYFNESFIEHLTQLRVNEAKRLIETKNYRIKDVGWKVGYHNPNYFTKVFKKIVGVTPREYKDQLS